MTVSAISTVSRVLRNVARDKLPPIDRDDSWSAAKTPAPVEEIAGNSPASNAVRNTRPTAKASTVASR